MTVKDAVSWPVSPAERDCKSRAERKVEAAWAKLPVSARSRAWLIRSWLMSSLEASVEARPQMPSKVLAADAVSPCCTDCLPAKSFEETAAEQSLRCRYRWHSSSFKVRVKREALSMMRSIGSIA